MNIKNDRIKILCLDDEQRILNSLKALFRFKYDVLTALNAAEAIEMLKTHNISVVISDQRMPEMTGSEFLKIAKEISPETTRILLTGFSDLDAIVSTVNDSEVYRFMTKPWGNNQITTIVAEAVEISLSMREKEEKQEVFSAYNSAFSDFDHARSDSSEKSTSQLQAPSQKTKENSYVICKSNNPKTFEEVKGSVSSDIKLLHARSHKEVLALLTQYPIKVMISYLDTADDDTELLKYLKRELPQLLTIGLVEFADYDEIVTLINEAKLYRYIIMPAKTSQLTYFINSAIEQHDRLNTNQTLLKLQAVMEDKPIKPAITGLFGRLRSFFRPAR